MEKIAIEITAAQQTIARLTQIKGIGESTAQQIVATLGARCIPAICRYGARTLTKVPGIGEVNGEILAARIRATVKAQYDALEAARAPRRARLQAAREAAKLDEGPLSYRRFFRSFPRYRRFLTSGPRSGALLIEV